MPSKAHATSAAPARAPKNIVVVGGGIVGVCTAYFLAISPHRPAGSKITLVEGTGVASAASGNAGGFLARDWHGPATASLSAMSFDLHRKLAEQFGGSKHWGYRSVDTLVSVSTLLGQRSMRARLMMRPSSPPAHAPG
jgi:glycine/D-amino acid oxidase-like deaminating enzyme